MGRNEEFGTGASFIERDASGNDTVRSAAEATSHEPWYVTQRYGGANQIPFKGPRQSPLPYPKTYADHVDDEYNERLDRSL